MGAMDDDAPLSALAKPLKLDDDTPLASLADVSKPKPSPKAKAGGSPASKPPRGSPKAAAGKAAGKATPKKKAAQSSSSSSSSGSDSSGSDSEEKPKPVRRKGSNASVTKKAKLQLLDKDAEDGDGVDAGGAVKKRDRSPKEQVVADLLCRWWYAMPEWPPKEEEYYEAELAKRSLRKVPIEEWEWVPEVDSKGRRKVYELKQFRGLFRSPSGELIDLRPKETCPCYANFMKKDLPELFDLLVTAFENQIKDLKNSKYNEAQLEQELKARLTTVRDKAYNAKQNGALKRRKSG